MWWEYLAHADADGSRIESCWNDGDDRSAGVPVEEWGGSMVSAECVR